MVTSVDSTSPITRALLHIATVPYLSRAWRTVDDWATIIGRVYRLDDSTSKGILTGSMVSSALTSDTAVNNLVDETSTGTNYSGIHRDKYRPRGPAGRRNPIA